MPRNSVRRHSSTKEVSNHSDSTIFDLTRCVSKCFCSLGGRARPDFEQGGGFLQLKRPKCYRSHSRVGPPATPSPAPCLPRFFFLCPAPSGSPSFFSRPFKSNRLRSSAPPATPGQPHSHAQRAARLPAAPVAAAAPAASTASPDAPASGAVPGKPTVLVAEKLGAAGLALLQEFANVDCSYGLSLEDLRAKISLCDALIVRSGTKVGRDVFEASGGRLRVVGRAGVGIDDVDLAAATEHGCLVVNALTTNTVAVAEHGIALLTTMARNIAQADASLKAGEFVRCNFLDLENDASSSFKSVA
jgi:hypothetical protein